MIINIFGSTGFIGRKSLSIIKKSFPKIKVNFLSANSNINILIKQIKEFSPRFVYLENINKKNVLKNKIKDINSKTKILSKEELSSYLLETKSDFTILAISGYKSLNNLNEIIINTTNLGIVSKEAIVSAGHIFKKLNIFKKTKIFPIDSEHYSIFNYLNKKNSRSNLNKLIITASGGPFLNRKHNELKKISFNEAINHPKWKMGYKNSIDSATLVNKCLEVVEAKYLFDLNYSNIEVLIHPQALVHSIIQNNDSVSNLILFNNDMAIPISNFLNLSKYQNFIGKNYEFTPNTELNFYKVNKNIFPIYEYFRNIDKNKPANIIKFNVGNEFAVNLFKNNKIIYTDIYTIIKKVVSLNLNSRLNSIKDIIDYHEELEKHINSLFINIT